MTSAGLKLKNAIQNEKPLKLLGVLNPFMMFQLEEAGFRAAYLSGAGLSSFNYGVPDVGVVDLEEFCTHIKTLTRLSKIPLLADADTGFGDPEKTVQRYIETGAAGLHIEDQTEDKRCGHLDGKSTVSKEEMVARIRAAVKGKMSGAIQDEHFMIMARTDALATEGFDAALERILAYVEAGADAVFAEAMPELEQYTRIKAALPKGVPLLANVTEYGKIKLYTAEELKAHGADMVLYPVSLARAMHGMVKGWLNEIKETGTTQGLVDRNELKARDYYNSVIGYNPKTDGRESVLKKFKQ